MLSWRESRATIDESCWLNSVSNRFLPTGGSAKGWAGWQRHACHHCNNNRHTSRQIYRLSYIITINFIQTKPDKSVATTTTNIRENPDNVFCFFFCFFFHSIDMGRLLFGSFLQHWRVSVTLANIERRTPAGPHSSDKTSGYYYYVQHMKKTKNKKQKTKKKKTD